MQVVAIIGCGRIARGAHLPALSKIEDVRIKYACDLIIEKAEAAKVAVRNVRRDANDAIKKAAKASEISEDEQKQIEDEIQKTTDKFVAEIDKCTEAKTAEIMTV